MTSTLTDLVDAVSTDLAANVTLPTHSLWKYVDPPILRPDLGNMLGVFPRTSAYQVEATNSSYEDTHKLVIAWYVPLVASPETGGAGDPAVAATALATSEAIIDQLRTYAVAIPGFADENEATVESARFGIIVGSTTWCAEITLNVTQWVG